MACTRITVYVLRLPNGAYYVGSTAKTPCERLAEHRKRFGKTTKLVASDAWCTTRDVAERIERKLAAKLRAAGKEVRQG